MQVELADACGQLESKLELVSGYKVGDDQCRRSFGA